MMVAQVKQSLSRVRWKSVLVDVGVPVAIMTPFGVWRAAEKWGTEGAIISLALFLPMGLAISILNYVITQQRSPDREERE